MRTIEQNFTVSYNYPVIFTRDVFSATNGALPEVIYRSGRAVNRVLIIIEADVYRGNPGLLERIALFADRYRQSLEFVAPPQIFSGGECCKKDAVIVESIHALVERYRICRHSFILAIGGGAFLDAVGYGAATAHRGIRLVRMPTTVLAQNDAGVGVKNGINAFGRKNYLGTFAPPFAVINDFDFLQSLPERELRAGIAEAVKVALIKDRDFFDFLYDKRNALAAFSADCMEKMITRCAELHMEHIGNSGDPFEFGSSRPLDFGHWAAHKLEDMTDGEIRHGEAVAIGIALDSFYSCLRGLISELDLRRILLLLEELGFVLYHPALKWIDIYGALEEFREHLGGVLSIPILLGIGNKIEAHEIDGEMYRQCVGMLAGRAKRKEKKHGQKEALVNEQGDSRYLFP